MAAEKKRVRWADSDDILGDDTERASKVPRIADDEMGEAASGPAEPIIHQNTTVCSIHIEGSQRFEEDADATLLEDIAEAEAAYEAPDSEFAASSEFPIEPFSLREERETGRFDAQGNYTPNQRDASFKDAWLESLPADMENVNVSVSEFVGASSAMEVGEAIEQLLPVSASEPDDAELARCKRRILDILRPGETVLGALRRLGHVGGAAAGVGGSLEAQRAQRQRMKTGRTVPPENREEFDNLTDWSSMLLKYGDYHAHTDTCEQMKKRIGGSQPEVIPVSPLAATQSLAADKSAGVDNDEDMFRESSPQPQQTEAAAPSESEGHVDTGTVTLAAAAPAAAAAPGSGVAPVAAPKSLEAIMVRGAGAEPSPASEDFAAAEATAADGCRPLLGSTPEPVSGPSAGDTEVQGGGNTEYEGFRYDQQSGYWFNTSEGYFYDAERQLFADSTTGQFYKYQDGAYTAA